MYTKRVVFIMSTGHSGSTLLELILGSQSRIFVLGEFIHLDRKLDEFDQSKPHLCGVCKGECEFWNYRVSFSVL